MKITKNMVNSELAPYFNPLKIFSFLLSQPWRIHFLNYFNRFSRSKNISGLHCEERYIPSKSGGPDIRVRIYKPLNTEHTLPAMLYNHGGGFVIGVPETSATIIEKFINTRPCVVIAPDYRKALTAPFPAGFDDCYDTLLWAKENAATLGIHSDKFMVAGHSAGGGLTAAVSLKARDTHDVNIAFQMPIYPMIDDRQLTESAKDMDVPVWNTKTNALAWQLYLQGLNERGEKIPAYAAPARSVNYTNLPPTITFVGDSEPFRDETQAYVQALTAAGIPVEFKRYAGCFHAFDILVPKATIAKEAMAFTYQAFGDYYDKYVLGSLKTKPFM